MDRRPVISEVGHVAVRVRDLEAAEETATNLMGLDITEREPDALWLSHGAAHHTLHYVRSDVDAIDHVGLVAPDEDAVAAVRARVEMAGWTVVRDAPEGPGVQDGFAFAGPDGAVFEIYSEMSQVQRGNDSRGVRPNRLGHVNFFARDHVGMQRMLIDVLDFRVSDRAGEGLFLHCNVDHHGIGVFPGSGLLHHYAWEVASIAELAAVADLVDRRGGSVLWGPMRHGAGHNIATYFQDPSGLVVEYYAEMQRIYDDEHHEPIDWDVDGHKWLSLWGPQPLPDGFAELGLPFATP